MNNPSCEGNGPHDLGEVRKLPVSTDPDQGNSILCHACYVREIEYRSSRNRELEPACRFRLPAWRELEVYES
jgi:hypothetical protein